MIVISTREYLFIDLGLPAPFIKINIMQTDPEFYMASHVHSFCHINRIMEGSLTVNLNGQEYFLSAGCIFVLPPEIPHALMSKTGYTQIGVDVGFENDPRGLVAEIQKLGSDFLMARTRLSAQEAKEELGNIHTLLTTPTITNVVRAVNLGEKQILDLIDGISNPQRDSFLEKFMEMISLHDPWNLTLADMCQFLSVSRTQLERQAHQAFGCGAVEYCSRLRYARVCELLHENSTLESIAADTGFCDACHLSKFFSARANQTPGQYRKSLGL